MTDRIRLHISPLNPELLRLVLPPLILPLASNISYHTLQTFPERNYGYVELPAMEGEKIKKKLNGSILKGSRVRVEEARPSRKRKARDDGDAQRETEAGEEKTSKPKKKQKLENGVIPGHELSNGRKVKRGWTEPVEPGKDKRSKDKSARESRKKVKTENSAYTDKPECLFKTKLPQSSEPLPSGKKDEKFKKKKSKKSDKDVVVHEFANTTKHASFLRDSQATKNGKPAQEFVEGQGWVDEDGNLVEKVESSKKPEAGTVTTKNSLPDRASRRQRQPSQEGESKISKPRKTSKASATANQVTKATISEEDDETSSSGTSSPSSDSSGSEQSEGDALASPATTEVPTLKVTPEPADNSAQTDQPSEAPSVSVHPLEALYKRAPPNGSPKSSLKPSSTPRSTPRNPNLKVHTSFSFFDANDDDAEDIPKTSKEVGDANDASFATNGRRTKPPRVHKNIMIPQTPFTQLDFHERGIRSAAPTPDTAAPNKMYFEGLWKRHSANSGSSDDEDSGKGAHEESSGLGVDLEAVQEEAEDEDEEREPDGVEKEELINGKVEAKEGEEKPESEFSKWFWEHRGETNRVLKQRRREAKKEKKRADRKKAGGRVI